MFTVGGSYWDTSTSWNQFDKATGITLSNNNRDATGAPSVRAIASASAGKKYYEVNLVSSGGPNTPYIGASDASLDIGSNRIGLGSFSGGYSHNTLSGFTFTNGTPNFGGSVPTFAAGDIIGVALDIDAGYIWFSKNGVWIKDAGGTVGDPSAGTNPRSTLTTGKTYFPAISPEGWLLRGNFAASDFVSASPTGFVAW